MSKPIVTGKIPVVDGAREITTKAAETRRNDSDAASKSPDNDNGPLSPDSESDEPKPPQQPMTLTHAVRAANADRIRNLLLKLCDEDALVKTYVSKELLPPAARANWTVLGKREALDTCLRCGEEFAEDDDDQTCTFHDGRKEVDFESGFWEDHDEEVHGYPESFVNDESYADGFTWTCCGQDGSHEGCKSGGHKPSVRPWGKKRVL